ncbi:MAG: rhomboid family intramembrane serine protease [Bacteroidota bacterium]
MITITFLIVIIAYSIYAIYDRNIMAKYLFHPYSIYHFKEHYRFLTHAFIHGDWMHLAFNCIALYSFGLPIENKLFGNPNFFDPKIGKILYILLFTGGIYAASLTEYFRNKNNPNYTSLGASGAISSILFCYIIVSPTSWISFFFFPLQGWIAGILLLSVSYVLIRRKRLGLYTDNISHESHFWGAIYGIAFIAVVKPMFIKHFVLEIAAIFH